jgi:Fe-S-cluster containining protein
VPGVLCEHCTAACCRYIALPIDTPETLAEFDDVRWFLLHEGVSVFVENGDWYIALETRCRHLQADHRCAIYATRPNVCRTYSTDDCDYHSGDYGWEQHFASPEHLSAFARAHARPAGCSSGRRSSARPRVSLRRTPAPEHDARGTLLPVLPPGT